MGLWEQLEKVRRGIENAQTVARAVEHGAPLRLAMKCADCGAVIVPGVDIPIPGLERTMAVNDLADFHTAAKRHIEPCEATKRGDTFRFTLYWTA